MKKLLLSGVAAAAIAFAATPAQADDGVIDLELGGFFKGYALYVDHDDDFGGAGEGADRRELDFRRSGGLRWNRIFVLAGRRQRGRMDRQRKDWNERNYRW